MAGEPEILPPNVSDPGDRPQLLADRSMGARFVAPKKTWEDEARSRIKADVIIDRFMQCVRGEIELDPTQIRAGEILLRKKLPDLAAVAVQGQADQGLVVQILRLSQSKQDNNGGSGG